MRWYVVGGLCAVGCGRVAAPAVAPPTASPGVLTESPVGAAFDEADAAGLRGSVWVGEGGGAGSCGRPGWRGPGGLGGALVWADRGATTASTPPVGRAAPRPADASMRGLVQAQEEVTLRADACGFEPAALAAAPGNDLVAVAGDAVVSFVLERADGPAFQPVQTIAVPPGQRRRFALSPGLFRVRSDQLPEAEAWLVVAEHAAVSGADGGFRLAGVPDGDWQVQAFHPGAGRDAQGAVVADGDGSAILRLGGAGASAR